MARLSGLMEFSMGNFLCIRGYASYKQLSEVSERNPDVQRDLIAEHAGEMARFLNQGEYRFFPEVVLSVSLLSDGNFEEVQDFYEAFRSNREWNKSLGGFNFSIFRHSAGDKNQIAHITFDESKVKLNRIDGNHRLSASDDVITDFKVPFCLVLCRNQEEESQYSRAIFHNINAKQIPLKLEQNLKVILESKDVFTDSKLKTDPSFGWEYYLARQVANKVRFGDYPFIQFLIRGEEYTYLLEEFTLLLKAKVLNEDEASVDAFVNQLPKIELALKEASVCSGTENLSVIGALSYYKLVDEKKYVRFLYWIKDNCITEAKGIHMADLISIFDKVYDNMPKKVFMSMQFGDETADTYQTVKDVQKILKDENKIDFEIIKVDEHSDGYSDDIYKRIVKGIRESALVIADLSYGNKNVHHEIGYAQALNKPVLLLYHTRDGVDPKQEIGSNITMYDQLRYKNQTDLRPRLLQKIKDFYGVR